MALRQGDLRLSGFFADQGSGRLEIFFNNQWGTICINGFTRESADTACRQLGRSRALSFGEADRLGYVFGIVLHRHTCYAYSSKEWPKFSKL